MTNYTWSNWLKQVHNVCRGTRSRSQNRTARKEARSRLGMESLEDRSVPAALTYVNDTWHLFQDLGTPGLSAGDFVTNANDGGPLTAYMYGTQAFGTVTTGVGITTPTYVAGSATINDAIAHTDAGGTVNVLGGTYTGGVLINKTLTVVGTGTPTVTAADLSGQSVGFQIGANDVVLAGFGITGTDTEYGVLLSDKAAGAPYTNATVRNNTFTHLGYAVATADGAVDFTNAVIRDNAITVPAGGWGVYLQSGSGHQLYGNTINGTSAGAGILVQNVSDVTIGGTGAGQGNTISGLAYAVYAATAVNTVFTGNTVTGMSGISGAVRLEGSNTGFTISQNTISGGLVPAVLLRDAETGVPNTGVVVNNNTLTGNSHGIRVTANGLSGVLDARFNNISGNTVANVLNDSPQTVNVSGSYLGSGVLAAIAPTIIGTGPTDYSPYLTSGADTDLALGFQGDYSQLGVHALGAQVGATGRIQEGINLVTPSGTVNVAAGTYDVSAGVTINKQLILAGARQGVSGTDASRGTGESILAGPVSTTQGAFNFNTTAAVTIDGFTINTTKIASGQPINSNLGFLNNVFNLQANSAPGGTGLIISTPTAFTLTNNSFTTTGSNPTNSAVIQVVGSYAGGADPTNFMNVTGNTFKGIADASFQSTLQLNFSDVQGNVQNNVFDGVDIGVLVAGNSGNLTIDHNTFKNITRGATEIAGGSFGAGVVFYNPTYSGPVTVSNNTFQNDDAAIRTSTDGSGTFTLNSPTVGISGNTFTGNLHDIVDKFAGTLAPAGNNNFSGITLSAATTAQLFAIADKVVDAIDVSGYGLVRLRAGNTYATPNSFFAPGGTTTASIQRAIDAAVNGDTVNVATGTYAGGADATASGKGITLSAGSGPALVAVTGAFTLDANDTLAADVNGSTAGTGNDQWAITGAVTLNGATSALTGTRPPHAGDAVVLVKNDGTDTVTGAFQGRAEGAAVGVNGVNYVLSYKYNAEAGTAGNGNDVALVDVTASQPAQTQPLVLKAVGTGPGVGAQVLVYNAATGEEVRRMSFPGLTGGVTVATGDVNGDAVSDILVGDATGSSLVGLFDGATGAMITGGFAFGPGYTGGVTVALGDLNGDGKAELIVGAATGSSMVSLFDLASGAMLSGAAFAPGYTRGVTVAAGDLNGDGKAELIVGTATGSSTVGVFDLSSGASYYREALPGFTGGVRVATAAGDVVIGAGRGGMPLVQLIHGDTGVLDRTFWAFDPMFDGGVYVG